MSWFPFKLHQTAKQVFTGADRERLVCVLSGWQYGRDHNDWQLNAYKEFSGGVNPDAFATAHYWGGYESEDHNKFQNSPPTMSQLYEANRKSTKVRERFEINKAIYAKHGVNVIAYEGGFAYVPNSSGHNYSDETIEFNTAPQMELLYEEFLEQWDDEGYGLICFFEYGERPGWNRYGNFGHVFDNNQLDVPKYRAVTKWK